MRTNFCALFIVLALLVANHPAAAQTAQFFRLVGPTKTTITKFKADGTLVWSNATPGATYRVQTSSTLAGSGVWVDYNQIVAGGSASTNNITTFNPPTGMVLIPAGEFTIGDTLEVDSEAPPANVTVSAFYMDVTLVTSNQWAGAYSYALSRGYSFDNPGSAKAANHPVTSVDWYDCVKWCNARSQQAGLTPAYYTDALFTQVYTNGDTDAVYPNWTANGYRLPTEAEWEKAARGGLSGQRFPWGDTISESQANYALGSGQPYDLGGTQIYATGAQPWTSPVGSFAPNGFGLYDMAGNLSEWCWDWADTPIVEGSPYLGGADPRGPLGPTSGHVLRGGGWLFTGDFAQCEFRSTEVPGSFPPYFGFRCMRGL